MINTEEPEVTKVLERLAKLFNTKNDAELAKNLRVRQTTLSMWRTRNNIPYKVCVNIAKRKGVSLDWLILGQNKKHENESIYLHELRELIDKFIEEKLHE